jgi:23S rRNA pseudouridine1911/1915/1917 synthase
LLVVAKDESTHEKLSRQFAAKTTEREYWAVVWGRFKEPRGIVDAPLARSMRDRKKMAIVQGGKSAVTAYEVIEQFDFLALVKLHLRTGRTHQIRVHMASLHHPVFCDATYGGDTIVAAGVEGKRKAEASNLLALMGRQALHAKQLGFVHPVTKEMMRFESELPGDMKALLTALRR